MMRVWTPLIVVALQAVQASVSTLSAEPLHDGTVHVRHKRGGSVMRRAPEESEALLERVEQEVQWHQTPPVSFPQRASPGFYAQNTPWSSSASSPVPPRWPVQAAPAPAAAAAPAAPASAPVSVPPHVRSEDVKEAEAKVKKFFEIEEKVSNETGLALNSSEAAQKSAEEAAKAKEEDEEEEAERIDLWYASMLLVVVLAAGATVYYRRRSQQQQQELDKLKPSAPTETAVPVTESDMTRH
mmetsp:Transcript_58063/g.136067  ORF Transcript_58063/g.136067 Transcript_58063/m.136067 type:complete len:241 (+) Transcript_58063:31-753(+)